VKALNFEPYFAEVAPETYELIMSANLEVHPGVTSIILHGSRGLAGDPRPDSDIDLSLLIDKLPRLDIERELQEVLNETLDHWRGPIELDLAVIFDIQNCGLKCFEYTTWNKRVCQAEGIDCFGLYKTQKEFHGLVTDAGIQVRLMYPCLKIWQRP
jgi:hypothetical protein